jgi:hypothetical protein
MMDDRSVIHKVVYRLDAEPGDLVQTFEVPRTAQLVSIDWDTRGQFGIALWYRFTQAHDAYTGPEFTTTWRLMVRGTGHSFMAEARHLATVVRDGFAWHLLDADGDHIRWARR